MAATLTTTAAMPAAFSSFGLLGNAKPAPSIRTYTLAWVSHTDGTVALPTDVAIVGEILRVAFKPNAGGTAPTDLYDVTITDAQGIDVLAGQGANLSGTVASHVCPGVPFKDGTTTSTAPIAVAGILTVNISNSGSGKGGTIVLYVA